MKRRVISLLLIVVLIFGMFPISANAAAKYSVNDAIAYAKAHWNDGKGLCAEFVSRCVKAGGLSMTVQTGTGSCYRAIMSASGLKRETIKLNASGYATKALNGDRLAKGDVVIQWCTTHNIAPHIMICGGYDSKGYATYYAHNGAMNNQRYNLGLNEAYEHTKACDMGGQVIRLSTLDPAVAGDSVSFNDTAVSANAYNATFTTKLSYTGTRPTAMGFELGSSQDDLFYQIKEMMGGTANPYQFSYVLSNLEHNTTYYYRFFAEVKGKLVYSNVSSFKTKEDTAAISVTQQQECGYRVKVNADTEVYCYNAPTSKDKYRYYPHTDNGFTLYCTQRLVMSDYTVRYRLTDSEGRIMYFRFLTGAMQAEQVHDYKETTVAATCTQEGYTNHVCACGNSYTDNQTAALGHSYAGGVCLRCGISGGTPQPEGCPGGGACPGKSYADMPPVNNWAHEGIDYCIQGGLMNGVSSTRFNPTGSVTRAQLVTIIYRMEGSPYVNFRGTFDDVKAGAWYANAVEWAYAQGIVTGKSATRFDPEGKITREQIAAILYRYNGKPQASGSLASFPDSGKVSTYAVDALVWATTEGLINGVSSGGITTLSPQNNATRAQIASIIMRYVEG